MDAIAGSTRPDRATPRRIDRLLGPGSALMLAAALAFFLLAMPASVLAALIAGLGLPPAVAGSPAGVALAAALLAGAGTWGFFQWLDTPGGVRPKPVAPVEATAPVLRRTDAHPDAPARRPIFAASDLGTPLDLIDPLPADDPVEPPPAPSPSASLPVAPSPVVAPSPAEPDEKADIAPPPPPAAAAPPPAPVLSYPVVSAAPGATVAVSSPPPSLSAVMGRLEAGLMRKAIGPGGEAANVTPLKREIQPYRGDLGAALDDIQRNTAGNN